MIRVLVLPSWWLDSCLREWLNDCEIANPLVYIVAFSCTLVTWNTFFFVLFENCAKWTHGECTIGYSEKGHRSSSNNAEGRIHKVVCQHSQRPVYIYGQSNQSYRPYQRHDYVLKNLDYETSSRHLNQFWLSWWYSHYESPLAIVNTRNSIAFCHVNMLQRHVSKHNKVVPYGGMRHFNMIQVYNESLDRMACNYIVSISYDVLISAL